MNDAKSLNNNESSYKSNTRGGEEQSLTLFNTISKRLMIFIDGGNLFHGAKNSGLELSYEKLIKFLSKDYDLIRVYYYTGVPKIGGDKDKIKNYNKQKGFLDYLEMKLNVDVVTKPLGSIAGRVFEKGIDVRIASDIIWHGLSSNYDVFILISGDKDLMDCLFRMKDNGKRVVVANFEGRVSKELKRIADEYINLSEHLEEIRR
ncbi:MAG: NYN domain-containing protein [Nanoarchaeota archaeon]|nr:NYN domain-containing protein [Nanoarchaeota archaeon]